MLFQKGTKIVLCLLSILGGKRSRVFRLRRELWREFYRREVDEYSSSRPVIRMILDTETNEPLDAPHEKIHQ